MTDKYTNHNRSSFSNAYKLVIDEVFIKSYIPPDTTQYSSTQLRQKAIQWRDENPREWCCAPRQAVELRSAREPNGEQLQVSHPASRNI